MKALSTVAFIALLLASAPAQSDPIQPAPSPSTVEVLVWLEDNSEPGVPVTLIGRRADGTVLVRSKTDIHGKALLTVHGSDRDALVRIEALLMVGAGREYGALQSLDIRQARVCIHLPRYPLLHCQD